MKLMTIMNYPEGTKKRTVTSTCMGNIDSRVSPFCILQAAVSTKWYSSVRLIPRLPWRSLKQLTLVAAGAIPSRISGLSVVSPQVQGCLERKFFSLGQIASGHLPLVQTHGQL